MKSKLIAFATGSVLLGSVLGAGTAFAATDTPDTAGQRGGHPQGMMGRGHTERPALFGKVTAISGTTLTVTGKEDPRKSTAEGVYSVDAANAKVTKDRADSSLGAIAVGDTVMVQGTVSGTSVTATAIHDGVGPKNDGTPPVAFVGNGQPILGGTVSAVSGSTLTVTNKSNVTYLVDGSSATVMSKGATTTLSSVVVGDAVVVQGAVNGTSVTATTILDNGAKPADAGNAGRQKGHGFFGAISGFLHNFFGFF